MLGRGKEEHAKRIAAEEAAAAKKAAEEEQQAKDEGLDAVTVALDRIGQSLKIINEDMTEDWGKTGLVRQQVKRAKAELRSNLVKAAKEMQRFAAGRREGDAEPPYMEMVDVDDLKAACNVYEKRLAEEHAHVRHLERSTKQLEKETEAQKAEIEELKGLRSQIAKLEVTNTKVESDLKREKGERIQGAGREYYLEEDLREARKEIEALTEEVRSLSKERVAGASRHRSRPSIRLRHPLSLTMDVPAGDVAPRSWGLWQRVASPAPRLSRAPRRRPRSQSRVGRRRQGGRHLRRLAG